MSLTEQAANALPTSVNIFTALLAMANVLGMAASPQALYMLSVFVSIVAALEASCTKLPLLDE
jgi:hypothetical protein